MALRAGVLGRGVIWRRRVIAIGGLVAVAALAWILFRGGGVLGPVDKHGARVEHLMIDSGAVGQALPVSVVLPKESPDGSPLPLLVFLHGRGEDEDTFLDNEMFTALAGLGAKAPIIAFPYGGDHSYWHDRDDGAWGKYVTGEVIPEVARRFHADASRVAIGGVSMGGFGAYDLARLHPGRFCAVGGHSPALWESAEETAPGAFDDAEDFASHDVIAAARTQPSPYTTQPIWLDAGDEDPFLPGDEAFAAALRSAGAPLTERSWPGGHDEDYWNSHWAAYLRFYADALSQCNR
jgi:S-formylglutathione hydrolase FrmB